MMAYPIGYRAKWGSRTGTVVDKLSGDAAGSNVAALKYVLYDEQTKALDLVDWNTITMLDPPPPMKGGDE